jgi:hypothetical protein
MKRFVGLAVLILVLIVCASNYTYKVSSKATLQTVDRIVLVSAPNGIQLQDLQDGSTIALSTLPSPVNILILTSPRIVGSVKFDLDGNTRFENTPPYAVGGDIEGVFNQLTLPIGSHRLEITPFSEANLTGTMGITRVITFTVTENPPATPTPEPTVTPLPPIPTPFPSPTPTPNPSPNPATMMPNAFTVNCVRVPIAPFVQCKTWPASELFHEALDTTWPSSEADRTKKWLEVIVAGRWQGCVVGNNRIRCWRYATQ